MPRTVIWKLDTVYTRAGGVKSIVESSESARKAGEAYIEKLKDQGEEILSAEEIGNKLIITLQ